MHSINNTTDDDYPLDVYNGQAGDNATQDYPPDIYQIAIPTIYGAECIFGLVGNMVVIVTLLKNRIQTIPQLLLLQLAITDATFLLILPILAYSFVAPDWVLGTGFCKFMLSLDGLNQFCGVFFLTVMSIDRYVTLVHSMKAMKYRSLKKAKIVVLAIWCTAVLVTIPITISAQVVPFEEKQTRLCIITEGVSNTFGVKSLVIYAFVLGFLVPILVITLCYVLILVHISKNRSVVSKSCSRKMSRRLSKIVLIYFSVFVVCWSPFYIIQFVTIVSEDGGDTPEPEPWFYHLYLASICLAYANGVLNPFVYTFSGKVFRQQVRQTFKPPHKRAKNKLQSQYIVLKQKHFSSSETTNSNCM